MYFPTSLAAFADPSFSQTLLNHIVRWPRVPQEIKNTFDELKQFAVDHGVIPRKGSENFFLTILISLQIVTICLLNFFI